MTARHPHVWIITALAVIIFVLTFFWWDPDRIPTEEKSALIVSEKSTHEHERSESRRHAHQEECASCPDFPVAETEKRSASTRDEKKARSRECKELLREAAEAGNPKPDLSHLGGCSGETPLHYAQTGEQVRLLIENGADPNFQDIGGYTPLHLQAVWLAGGVGEEGTDVIQALLEAGADPWIAASDGRTLPLDLVHQMSTTQSIVGFKGEAVIEVIEVGLKARGMSRYEAERNYPYFKKMMEYLENPSKPTQEAVSLLIRGMRQTRDLGVEVPEHLKEFFR